MYMKQKGLKLIILFTVIIFSNCSTAGESDSSVLNVFKGNRMLPDGVSRIYIDEIFDGDINSSIKETFGIVLREKINTNSSLYLVDSSEKSDLTMRVRLTGYSSKPVKFTSSGEVIETKLRLDAYVRLIYTSTGEEKLRNKLVESELVYSDKNPPIMSEYSAMTALTEQLAQRIISVITTGWYLEKKR